MLSQTSLLNSRPEFQLPVSYLHLREYIHLKLNIFQTELPVFSPNVWIPHLSEENPSRNFASILYSTPFIMLHVQLLLSPTNSASQILFLSVPFLIVQALAQLPASPTKLVLEFTCSTYLCPLQSLTYTHKRINYCANFVSSLFTICEYLPLLIIWAKIQTLSIT